MCIPPGKILGTPLQDQVLYKYMVCLDASETETIFAPLKALKPTIPHCRNFTIFP